MNLKNIYVEMCKDSEFLSQYSKTGDGKFGKMFAFQNTNYRLLLSFITNYKTFKKGADGIDRSLWELNGNHGQEKLKQHTQNMIKSRFFSKNKRTYYHTRKGEVLENISSEYSEEEKWILVYLLLIDSYFDNTPNYILKRSEEVWGNFLVYEKSNNDIIKMLLDFINESKTERFNNFFEQEYLYFDTFHTPFKNYDFLANYVNSNEYDKKELYDYIVENHEKLNDLLRQKKNNDPEKISKVEELLSNFNNDVISSKYCSGGVYTKGTIIDNAKILYISTYINSTNFKDFVDFIHKVIDKYAEIETIDSRKIYRFIFASYKDIYENCYVNIFDPDYDDDIPLANNMSEEEENEILEEVQKISVIEDLDQRTKSSSILKKKALERAEYKCELEGICHCSSLYFTSKKTQKNYMEVHHLIPREFSNDFEKSIEQIENYVSLCPRCHRFIHYATDEKRKPAINYLYDRKIGSLNNKGIEITEKQLNQYYKIEE